MTSKRHVHSGRSNPKMPNVSSRAASLSRGNSEEVARFLRNVFFLALVMVSRQTQRPILLIPLSQHALTKPFYSSCANVRNMKVILSRKGFDSEAGGGPSPQLPDGRLISLPIPEYAFSQAKLRYDELHYGRDEKLIDLMKSLGYGKFIGKKCHLDPDLCVDALEKRRNGWRSVFGQCEGQQTHLKNQEVQEDDIFLFFGWFRKTRRNTGHISFDPLDKKGKHVLFGYLQIGEILACGKQSSIPAWLEYHPHAAFRDDSRYKNNTIYISRSNLSFDKSLPGAGTFRCDEKSAEYVVLSKEGHLKSHWTLPDFLREAKISYHSPKSWKNDYFQSVARGQEFVIHSDGKERIEKWVKDLIKNSRTSCPAQHKDVLA